MQEEVVKDNHGSHAAFTLPGKWTLASQECSREFSEWRCSGSESGWSLKGLAAQLEDHTHTPIHTCTLHTWHMYACHTQTTPTYHASHVCTHTTHTLYVYHTHVYNHMYTITCIPTRQATDTYTHISHKFTCATCTTHHTCLYTTCTRLMNTPHYTYHMHAAHTHIHIYHTYTHINPTVLTHLYHTDTAHVHKLPRIIPPTCTHLCYSPQFPTYYIHTTSIHITHIHKHIYSISHKNTLTVQT